MRHSLLFVLLSTLIFAGCASNPMTMTGSTEVSHPAAGQAQVVFMRSSLLGSAISASLYDVTEGNTVFIGIINNGTKVSYTTTPGKHTFMVVSEAADFMEADLAAGKNYFSMVTPRMGAWKARFSLWPIKNKAGSEFYLGSDDFKNWLSSTKVAVKSAKAQAWYQANKTSIESKKTAYWQVWQQKSAEAIKERTLSQDDGL